MRDDLAQLASLTLPTDVTTGRRIVLDGDAGLIQVYDTADLLRIELGQIDGVRLFTGDTAENIPAHLNAVIIGAGGTRRLGMFMDSPSFAGGGVSSILVRSESFDGTVLSKIQLSTEIVDVESSITNGDIQLNSKSLPRGIVGTPFDSAVNDSARAAGVNTDMFVTFTADATRLYKVTCRTQFNVGTAAVAYEIEAVEGGTVGANDGTAIDRFYRWPAAAAPAGSLTLYVSSSILYQPTAGSKTVRVASGPGSGGTILTSGAASTHRQLWVTDIGAR